MSTQLGNSGRGTDGPAPPLTEEERLRAAVASRGKEEPDPEGKADSDHEEATERRTGQARADESDPEGASQSASEEEETDQQPGGGHWSESEKPDSPDSRWGGGR
jgi:hypothetical protein